MTTPEAATLEEHFAPMRGEGHAGVPPGAKTAWLRASDPRTAEGSAKRKAEWGVGPWWGEPDRVEWRLRGLACLVLRNRMGALCGYVGVPPGHACHGATEDDGIPVNPHGGVTYTATCGHTICHVPEPGEPPEVWWIGFDCSHAGDLSPGLRVLELGHDGWTGGPKLLESTGLATDYEETDYRREIYRALPYVVAEVERLAEALTLGEEVAREACARAEDVMASATKGAA